jgi:hypothetical protein
MGFENHIALERLRFPQTIPKKQTALLNRGIQAPAHKALGNQITGLESGDSSRQCKR